MADLARVLFVALPTSVLTEAAGLAGDRNIQVHRAATAVEAIKILGADPVDLLITQARLGDASGLKLVRRARSLSPRPDVLVVGPPVSSSRRAEILASGAEDYLEAPVSAQDIVNRAEQTLSARRMGADTGLLGRSPKMLQVFEIIRQVAPTRITVFIVGESGTGKEVAARAIHHLNPQRSGPFIAVNCGAIPEGLLESELFGHEKGAFTGAFERHAGRFEQAHGGTLFLDEIGETPPSTQVKLLRALEEQIYYRVGGSKPIRSDVRLITATNANLEEAVARGTFRRDLYFRLRVVTLVLPPLRERVEDISLLIDHFLAEAAARHGGRLKSASTEARELLTQNPWPGNVRELRNLIESLSVLVSGNRIEADDIAPHLARHSEVRENLPVSVSGTREDAEREMIYRTLMALRAELMDLKSIILGALEGTRVVPANMTRGTSTNGEEAGPGETTTLSEAEDRLIAEALGKTRGNRRKAAHLLGISERTLYRRLKRVRS